MTPDEAKLRAEVTNLRARLNETEETLHAIRSGEVDALVVQGEGGSRLFVLQDADAETNRFRSDILSKIGEAIVAVDEERRVIYLNAAAELRYEVEASAVLGEPLTAVYRNRWLAPGDQEKSWAELIASGHWRGTSVHVKRDGKELHVETSVSRLLDKDGRPAGMLGVIRDISAQMKAEDALRVSREQLQNALTAAALGTWNFDARSEQFTADTRFRTLCGHDSGTLTWQDALDAVHPDDRARVMAAGTAATRPVDPLSYDVEYRVMQPNSVVRWVAAKGSARFEDTSEGRKLVSFEGTLGDISVRKKAELDAKFLAEVSQDLAALSDVNAIMNTIGMKLGTHLGLSLCNFVEVSEAADETFVKHAWHRSDVPSSVGRYKLSEYLSAEFQATCRRGEPFVVRDTNTDPRTNAAAYAALRMEAFVCMPLVQDGRWCFLINSHHSTPHDWTTDELALIRELTSRVWSRLERIRIESALHDAKQRFDIVRESAQVGFWFCDLPFDKLDWDNRVKEHFWLSPDTEATIDLFYERMHPEDRERTRRAIEVSITNKGRYEIDYRTVSSEGQVKWIRAIGRGFYNENGQPIRFDGVTLDITERKRAEELLLDSEAKLAAATVAGAVGTWIWELVPNVLTANPALAEAFDLDVEQVRRGMPAEVYINKVLAEDRPSVEKAITRAMAPDSDGIYEVECRTRGADGKVRWLFARGKVEFDAERKPVRMPGALTDITERRQAEATVREGRERLQAALNGSGTGTFRWNIQTNELDWDENLDRLFGLPPGQTIRSLENFIAVVHPDEQPGVIERCQRCAREGADFAMEFRIIWPDGSIRWLDDQGATVRDAEGQPLYMTGMCLDITERKHAEEALRAAKERAEAASRSKDDFLAALSHELRTPLTPVLMTAAVLKDDARLSDDIREQLGMMERNIALEARLIDDLLDLTAISHGKLNMRLEACDLNTIVQRAIEMVAQDAAAKKLEIVCEFSVIGHTLMGDLTRIQQVVWNLLRNAVKFTPKNGKISIHTREFASEEGEPWLKLEIADTGIGIEATHIAKIFLPFDQGSLSGSHRFGGLGLGLAIAQAVVVAHGGRIQAQSKGTGQGATFVIDLPLAPASAVPAKQAPQSSPKTPTAVSPLRLLLVEDHESTLQTLASLLRRDGHQVTTANTIANAQTAASQDTFDLVISDLGLPDGNGNQLMARLRATHGLRGIALSGYGMEEDIAQSREAGFVAHLVKPVAIAELRRKLDEISRR